MTQIIIDSREQKPLIFPIEVDCVMRKLDSADYSLTDYETKIGVERKKLSEIVSCMTTGQRRFRNQLKRLKKLPYRCVIIESDMYSLCRKNYVGYIRPDEALDLMTALMVEFKIPFYMVGKPEYASRFVLSFLLASKKQVDEKAPRN